MRFLGECPIELLHFWVKRVKAKGRGREAETWTAALTRRRSARWMP